MAAHVPISPTTAQWGGRRTNTVPVHRRSRPPRRREEDPPPRVEPFSMRVHYVPASAAKRHQALWHVGEATKAPDAQGFPDFAVSTGACHGPAVEVDSRKA